MPLPILHTSDTAPETLVRLFHKTELHLTQHLAEETALMIGSAFANLALGSVSDANRILGASLPEDATLDDLLAESDAHYQQQAVRCQSWVMNPSASPEQVQPLVRHLESLGYQRQAVDILHMDRMPGTTVAEVGDLKIIPARASYRHAQILAEQSAKESNQPQLAEAAMMHLDDPHCDALLALKEGAAVASVNVLAAGEIGRIDNLFVSPDYRGRGIGQTMMSRALEVCARSLFRHIFVSCHADHVAARALFTKLGFRKVGDFVSYRDARS